MVAQTSSGSFDAASVSRFAVRVAGSFVIAQDDSFSWLAQWLVSGRPEIQSIPWTSSEIFILNALDMAWTVSRVGFRSPRSTCPIYVQWRSLASPISSWDQPRLFLKSRIRLPRARLMSLATGRVLLGNTYISRDYKYYFRYDVPHEIR